MSSYYSIPILVQANCRTKRYRIILASKNDMMQLRKDYRLRAKATRHSPHLDLSQYLHDTQSVGDGFAGPLLPLDYVPLAVKKYQGLSPTTQHLVKLDDKKILIIPSLTGAKIKELSDVIDWIEPGKLEGFLSLLDLDKQAQIEETTVIFQYLR